MIDNYVTGASGFIGSHLIKKLKGVTVSLPHKELSFSSPLSSDRKLFFLSTYGNMISHTNHYEMVNANIVNLIDVIGNFRGWLCYMSSSSVTLPVQTPYSRTKRGAEEILQALPEIKSCIVRPYSVTGVGEQKEHLIPTLIRSCMEGTEMPFDPYPVHDFVDVEDVVNGLIKVADEGFTGIIEFGNGVPYCNWEVRGRVQQACGKSSNTQNVKGFALRSYDNMHWFCRSKHPLWMPKKTLKQSIAEMVEAYKHDH